MQFLGRFLLVALLTPTASVSAPPESHRAANLPNILIITLDTTRADRMGFLGSSRGLTPNLDALARNGVVFTQAYAHVPLTTPSHASIFTGTYPQFNRVIYMGQPLTDDLPYLPAILRKDGYRTAAFVGSLIVDSKNPVAMGFGRGFDTYDAPFHNRARNESRYGSVERRAGQVVDRTLAWLKTNSSRPFFVWVHCYDPHAPYDPPEPFNRLYASDPYDGEIAYMDSAIGNLIAGLRTRGWYDNTLIAVMADHGEALGEHGEHHHGIFLYDETVHVPLIFKLPSQQLAGKRVDNRARLVDVAPTILQGVNLKVPHAMQGESLLKLMKASSAGTQNADRPAYAETDYAHRAFGWSSLRSWRSGKFLYIDAPERELYDQVNDKKALHNLAARAKAVADTMQAQTDSFRRETGRAETLKSSLSTEQAESLRALGYIGTDLSSTVEGESRGADPKGKTDIANLLDEALVAMQDQEYGAAIPKLEQVLKIEPNTPLAYLEMGRAYVHMNQPEKALPFLRTAVEKLPDDGMARFTFGRALVETGHWEEAEPQFEAALARNSNSPDLHFYLALLYQKSNRIPQAMNEFRETLKRAPDHFKANLLLGRLLGMQGQGVEALPYLQRAAKLDSNSVEAHMFLANVYAQLGQTQNVARENAEVERLRSSRAH